MFFWFFGEIKEKMMPYGVLMETVSDDGVDLFQMGQCAQVRKDYLNPEILLAEMPSGQWRNIPKTACLIVPSQLLDGCMWLVTVPSSIPGLQEFVSMVKVSPSNPVGYYRMTWEDLMKQMGVTPLDVLLRRLRDCPLLGRTPSAWYFHRLP